MPPQKKIDKTKIPCVEENSRMAFFKEHPLIESVLLRDDVNSSFKNREYHFTSTAYALLVDTLRQRRNSNSKNIFVVKKIEDLKKILQEIEFKEGEDAKLVFFDKFHSTTLYIRQESRKLCCFVFDSHGIKKENFPHPVITALKESGKKIEITVSESKLQEDNDSGPVFSFKALVYFCKHGKELFKHIENITELKKAEECYFLPAEKLVPSLLKLSQNQNGLTQKSLGSIVSQKTENNQIFNIASLKKKYHYFEKINTHIETRLKIKELKSDQPLHRAIVAIEERLSSLPKKERKKEEPILFFHVVKKMIRTGSVSDKDIEILNKFSSSEDIINLKKFYLPSNKTEKSEEKKSDRSELLPLLCLAWKNENKDKNHSEESETEYYKKLINLFKDTSTVMDYLENFEKNFYFSRKLNPVPFSVLIKEACCFNLPSDNARWSPDRWRSIAIKHMPAEMPSGLIPRILPLADRIEAFIQKDLMDKSKKSEKETEESFQKKISLQYEKEFKTVLSDFVRLNEIASQVCYKNSFKNLKAAAVFFNHQLPESEFDLYLTCKPNDDPKKIPDISIDLAEIGYPGHIIKKLPPDDPRAAVLGHLTNCCQSFYRPGYDSAWYGINNPSAGFYVLYVKEKNKAEEIMAQCMVWRDKRNYFVFDSIETQMDFARKNQMLVCDGFTYLADYLVKNKMTVRVLAGKDGATSKNIWKIQQIKSETHPDPHTTRVISPDSFYQYIIADSDLPVFSLYTKLHKGMTRLKESSESKEFKCMEEWYKQVLCSAVYGYRFYVQVVTEFPKLEKLQTDEKTLPVLINYQDSLWILGRDLNGKNKLSRLDNQPYTANLIEGVRSGFIFSSKIPVSLYHEIIWKDIHFHFSYSQNPFSCVSVEKENSIKEKMACLHYLINGKEFSAIKYFLDNHPDIDTNIEIDSEGNNLLWIASNEQNSHFFYYLVKRGANLLHKNKGNRDVISLAERNDWFCLESLWETGVSFSSETMQRLFTYAIRFEKWEIVKKLAENKIISLDKVNEDKEMFGKSPLHWIFFNSLNSRIKPIFDYFYELDLKKPKVN